MAKSHTTHHFIPVIITPSKVAEYPCWTHLLINHESGQIIQSSAVIILLVLRLRF